MMSRKALALHSVMYGLNMYQEIRQLIRQYKVNKYQVFYFSKVATNIELFVEFIFEILKEKDEPLVAFIELFKCLLKLKEYKDLLSKEKAQTYMELESYEDMKKLEEIKKEQIRLRRSKRNIPRIKGY